METTMRTVAIREMMILVISPIIFSFYVGPRQARELFLAFFSLIYCFLRERRFKCLAYRFFNSHTRSVNQTANLPVQRGNSLVIGENSLHQILDVVPVSVNVPLDIPS